MFRNHFPFRELSIYFPTGISSALLEICKSASHIKKINYFMAYSMSRFQNARLLNFVSKV